MSVTGLCQICESREADHSCPNCGNQVCEQHWNDGMSLCVQCAPTGENVDPDRVTPDDLDDEDVMKF